MLYAISIENLKKLKDCKELTFCRQITIVTTEYFTINQTDELTPEDFRKQKLFLKYFLELPSRMKTLGIR